MARRRAGVTPDLFRNIALGLRGVEEQAHMCHPDFRVGGRILATLDAPRPGYGMVRLSPQDQESFIERQPAAFSVAPGAWGRSGCTFVDLAKTDTETVGEALTLAWRLATAHPVRKAPSPRVSKPEKRIRRG